MAKGIIVTDIPCNCYECGNHNYHECSWNGENIEEYLNMEERHPKCPIQKLPKRLDKRYCIDNEEIDYARGWNKCIDEISSQKSY